LDYPATHFETLITPLLQPLPLVIINTLYVLARLTPLVIVRTHPSNTLPASRIPHFWPWGLLRYPSITHTLNTFVPPTQWEMCYLYSFAGKTHQVKDRPAGGWAIFDIHPERRCIHLTRDKDILDQFAQAAGDIKRLLRQPPARTAPIHPSRLHLLRRNMLSPNSRLNAFN
jgi:hypothetical protein